MTLACAPLSKPNGRYEVSLLSLRQKTSDSFAGINGLTLLPALPSVPADNFHYG